MQVVDQNIKQIPILLDKLPDYVTEFYNYKKVHTQPTTNLGYLREINVFMDWLRSYKGIEYSKPLSSANDNKDIPLSDLAKLNTSDMNNYIYYMQTTDTKNGRPPVAGTINHSISALKSFFNFLAVESEVGPERKPYISFNPMAKVKMLKNSATLKYRHEKINDMLYVKKQLPWLNYIDNDYSKSLKGTRSINVFKRNKERDLAIIALLMASGTRVSELTGLNLKDLKMTDTHGSLTVIRKGNHLDSVGFVPWAIPYLKRYLEVRKDKFKASDDSKALFVSLGGKRLTSRSVERLVAKYSTAFGRNTTPHKLRHTLASEMYEETKDSVAVAEQLGQTTTSATDLYTHLGDDKLNQDLSYIGEEEKESDNS